MPTPGTAGDASGRIGPAPHNPAFGDSARVASVPESVAAIAAARSIAAVGVESLSDDECLGMLDDVELAQRSLAAAAMAIAAQVEARELCDRRYGTAARVWYERRHRRQRSNVARQIRTGTTLSRHLPDLFDALARGDISVERAEFIASKVNDRNAQALEAAQEAFLALSDAEPSYRRFCALVDDLARYADPDGGHDPDDSTNRVSMHRTGNELALTAVFCGPVGETVEQLLDAETNRLWRQWRRDAALCPDLTIPSRTELRAQAMVELLRRGNLIPVDDPSRTASSGSTSPSDGPSTGADGPNAGADGHSAVAPTADDTIRDDTGSGRDGPAEPAGTADAALARTELTLVIDADRVDQLDPLLAAALDQAGFGPLPACTGAACSCGQSGSSEHNEGVDRCGQADAARTGPSRCSGPGGGPGLGHLVGQPVTGPSGHRTWFSAQEWQLLMCTADIDEVLLDRLGMPTAVRRRDRYPNRAMRRALVARDGGCTFPGCEAPPAWTDAHHVIEHSRDGDTVSHNLVLLCRLHHGVVHRLGWSMAHVPGAIAAEGYFTITTPSGYRLSTQHRQRPAGAAGRRQPGPG